MHRWVGAESEDKLRSCHNYVAGLLRVRHSVQPRRLWRT